MQWMLPAGEAIQWSGWIIGLLSGSVVIYKYFLKRPSLRLEVDPIGTLDENSKIPLRFNIVNDGRKFGEDVMLLVEFEDMHLVDFNREKGLTITDHASEMMFGKYAEYNEITPPEADNFDFDEKGNMTLNKERAVQIDNIMFQLRDVIYSRIDIQFTTRLAYLAEESAEIEYYIACRTHEPREGTIELEVNGDEVTTTSTRSTLRTRIRRRLARFSP